VHAAADQMARLYSDGNGLVRQQPGVLHSAFAVVRVLGRMQFPVGVTRLAAETGIPKTTVHRLLEQLADENVVERVERRWILGGGLHDLDRRLQNLASVAHPRLRSIAQATGASLFLYARSGQRLDVMSCSYGARLGRAVTRKEQHAAAENSESVIWLALNSGRLAVEHRAMHPDCRAIAAPLCLPTGEAAAVGFGLPAHRDMEPFKAPLAEVAAHIETDMLHLVS
jgi:DNA-binding IclR family transcriptional regulator